MWIFSQDGFYSIVQKGEQFHIRARRRQNLVNVGLTATTSNAGSDYLWGAILPGRDELLVVPENLIKFVDYPNYEGRIGERLINVNASITTKLIGLLWPGKTILRRLKFELSHTH